jgi:uncharacterized membrane protein YhaH (DUF805 family)
MGFLRYLFSFSGRIGRLQWWLGGFAQLLVASPFMLLLGWGAENQSPGAMLGSLAVLPLLVWSGLALTVKRLHDHDKSGWWMLVYFIPIIGAVWQMIECGLMAGTSGENDFGPDPLFSFNVDDEIAALRAKAETAKAPAASVVQAMSTQPPAPALASGRPVFGKRV